MPNLLSKDNKEIKVKTEIIGKTMLKEVMNADFNADADADSNADTWENFMENESPIPIPYNYDVLTIVFDEIINRNVFTNKINKDNCRDVLLCLNFLDYDMKCAIDKLKCMCYIYDEYYYLPSELRYPFGTLINQIETLNNTAIPSCFNNDRTMITYGINSKIVLYDVVGSKIIKFIKCVKPKNISFDGNKIVCVNTYNIITWDITENNIKTINMDYEIIATSLDGTKTIRKDTNELQVVIDIMTNKLQYIRLGEDIYNISVSNDGKKIAYCDIYGKLMIYNIPDIFNESNLFNSREYNIYGSEYINYKFGERTNHSERLERIELIELMKHGGHGEHEKFQLIGHTKWVYSTSFNNDGSLLASGGNDKTIQIWDTKLYKQYCDPLVGHTDTVNLILFSKDDTKIISGSFDLTIRVWDILSKELI